MCVECVCVLSVGVGCICVCVFFVDVRVLVHVYGDLRPRVSVLIFYLVCDRVSCVTHC